MATTSKSPKRILLGTTIDDTLARKRGLKIFGVGMHHDPLLSTQKTALMNWGHSWVVLGVIVKLPFRTDLYFCLPVLFRMYLNKQAAARGQRVYRTRPELAVLTLARLCKHRESRSFHAVADSAYGGQSVLKHLPSNCGLTSRLHVDARLYDAPPERKPGTNGRPRKRGDRLPTPRELLDGRARRVELDIDGRRDRVRIGESVARWHCSPERPLRVVAVDPLSGGRTRQAFYSARHDATAEQVLNWYARRWSIEQKFQNSKTHLGFEQPQGWSRQAVERTAPMAMVFYSLIVLWFATSGHREFQPPHRPWYRKKCRPTFADMLATLRHTSIRHEVSKLGLAGKGSRKLIKTLQNVATLAA